MPTKKLTAHTKNFKLFADSLPEHLEVAEGIVSSTLTDEARNFQFALTRLITDVTERRAAELDGVRFQVKYGLTNDQMFSLARIAGDCGEILLKPNWQASIQKLITEKGHAGLVGTCSCCCP